MLLFILGFIVGVLNCFLLIVFDLLYRKKVHTQGIVKHVEQKYRTKGAILEPMKEEFTNWIEDLKSE